MRIVEPRAARDRAAVRARARRPGRRRHARVRLPGRGARRCRTSPATCCPRGLSAAEIDAAVRERTERGEAIYELDAERAARARARPDRHPGAVPGLRGQRTTTCARWPRRSRASPKVVALDPHDVRRDHRRRAHDRPGDGLARAPRSSSSPASARGSTPCASPCARRERVPVAAIEWFDPVFVAGHWTPQLIEHGRRHRRARLRRRALRADAPGRPSRPPRPERRRRHAVRLRRRALARRGRALRATRCATVGAERVVAVDASAYFSRPGPRLVDGLELARPHPASRPGARAPRRRSSRSRSEPAHRPLPALLGRPLRRRPPAARDRRRGWTRERYRPLVVLPEHGALAADLRARASRCWCGRWRCCGAR